MEPVVIKHLAKAAASLQAAQRKTGDGFTSDHCENAMREVVSAIQRASGGSDLNQEKMETAVEWDDHRMVRGHDPGQYCVYDRKVPSRLIGTIHRDWPNSGPPQWIVYAPDGEHVDNAPTLYDAYELLISADDTMNAPDKEVDERQQRD